MDLCKQIDNQASFDACIVKPRVDQAVNSICLLVLMGVQIINYKIHVNK